MFSVIGTVMILTSALYVAVSRPVISSWLSTEGAMQLTKERDTTEKPPTTDALEQGLIERGQENETNDSGGEQGNRKGTKD